MMLPAVYCVRKELESVAHLFFTCDETWKTWHRWANNWGLMWVNHRDPLGYFLSWNVAGKTTNNGNIWRMAFLAIIWSIWLARNDVLFKSRMWDCLQVYDIMKLHVA